MTRELVSLGGVAQRDQGPVLRLACTAGSMLLHSIYPSLTGPERPSLSGEEKDSFPRPVGRSTLPSASTGQRPYPELVDDLQGPSSICTERSASLWSRENCDFGPSEENLEVPLAPPHRGRLVGRITRGQSVVGDLRRLSVVPRGRGPPRQPTLNESRGHQTVAREGGHRANHYGNVPDIKPVH